MMRYNDPFTPEGRYMLTLKDECKRRRALMDGATPASGSGGGNIFYGLLILIVLAVLI